MMLLNLIFIFSLLFPLINHPLALGSILLIQTLLISLTLIFFSINFWFSYLLFLIMIGGMLVLFIYMTSIASNEMLKMSIMIIMIFIILMISLTLFYTNFDYFIFPLKMNKNNLMFLNKFINTNMKIMFTMIIIHLFITLIIVVKITNWQMGPIRQKF